MCARSLPVLLRHAGRASAAALIASSASCVPKLLTEAIKSSVAGFVTANVSLELTHLPLIKPCSLNRL